MLLHTQKHNQGRVLTNTRYICRKPPVSKPFLFILPHRLSEYKQPPNTQAALGRQGACPGINPGILGKGQPRGRGTSSPPRLPLVRAGGATLVLLSVRLQHTRHMCVPKDRRSRTSRWGTFFFFPLLLFLSPKSTHDLKAKQTHPQIPALPGRDSSLFKLDPFRHSHNSIDVTGPVELEPTNIHRAML